MLHLSLIFQGDSRNSNKFLKSEGCDQIEFLPQPLYSVVLIIAKRKREDLQMRFKYHIHIYLVLFLLLTACVSPSKPTASTRQADACPPLRQASTCYTPLAIRTAYDVESLIQKRLTGKGQTIIDIVSYGSPTIQQDLNVFDTQFGLPPLHVQVLAPLGASSLTPQSSRGWAIETALDVEMMHAIAPDAHIVVMTSPVLEPILMRNRLFLNKRGRI